ncbi:MAG: inosine/xanthosine triphosphatase [Methanomassiliicoccales archaeon]
MKVAVGGTFNVLHRGHKALLDKAFALGDEVVVGITSDTFASVGRKKLIALEDRIKQLQEYLSTKNKKWRVEILEDPYGSAVNDPDLEILVASVRTAGTGRKINELRRSKGFKSLAICAIPLVLADDCTPISSTRILNGEIDEEGRMLRPIFVKVGSENPVKIRAVQAVMKTIFKNVVVEGTEVERRVGEQPWNDDTIRGAIERANQAIGDADFGVGIEAGVFEIGERLYDIQYCAVVDKMGRATIGQGSGFEVPACVEGRLRSGDSLGKIFEDIAGVKNLGRKKGVIHYLTKGLMTRQKLTEQCVLMAMIPRIRKELYFER